MGNIAYDTPAVLIKRLDDYCMMTGLSKHEVEKRAMWDYLAPYQTDDDKDPIPALFLDGNSEYERVAAENEGRKPEIKEVSCFVLGETSIFGEPKYRILTSDGRLMKVNQGDIRFLETNSDGGTDR